MTNKYLSVRDIDAIPTGPIWVLNTAPESELQVAGDVHLGIPKLNGSKIDPLFIPQTWLPIDITEFVPRAQLLESAEFRNAVAKQLITIITPEFAQEILQQEGASEERDRLAARRRAIRDVGAARSLTKGKGEVTMVGGDDADEDDTPQEAAPKKKKKFATGFLAFAESLISKPDMAVMNAIRSRRVSARAELLRLKTLLKDKPKTLSMLNASLKATRAPK